MHISSSSSSSNTGREKDGGDNDRGREDMKLEGIGMHAATPVPAPQNKEEEEPEKLHLPLCLTLAGAAFLNTLSVQSTVIILPSIGRELDIPPARQQWVISAYYLSFGCFLLLWGRLADMFGRRNIFLAGSSLLTITTVAVPFAPSEIVLDTLRGLQGLGAAANVPTAIGILGTTFKPGRYKNYAFAIYSAGSSCGNVLGNIFSGVVAQFVTWKVVFWLSAGLAGVVTVAGHVLIPGDHGSSSSSAYADEGEEALQEAQTMTTMTKVRGRVGAVLADVDWTGGTLVTVGLLLLNFALTEGNMIGWDTVWVPILIVASLVLLILFVLWEWYLEARTSRAPLMRVSIFRVSIHFNAAQVIMSMFFAAFNNYLVYATYFYQDYLGLGPLDTAIRFIPTGVMGLVGNLVAAKLLSRVAGSHLLIFSTLCVATSCILMAAPITPSTTYWAYGFPAMVLSTLGADILHPTLNLFVAESLPAADQSVGSALLNCVLQLGRAVALTIATVIQTTVSANGSEKGESAVLDVSSGGDSQSSVGSLAFLQGIRAAQWFNFGLATTACLVVLLFFRGNKRVGAVTKKQSPSPSSSSDDPSSGDSD